MDVNSEVYDIVMKAVAESYNGQLMPVGDEVTVVLKDSTVLVSMELLNGNRHLKVSICPDKPIMLTHYNLIEK
ncbi:hypothetical protein HWB81_gp30 [Bacillus phage Wes44]|uniref:Uncharacterized protein n=1 Tax=Bacillus phage Wes44 TaxID=2283012 RepID=A0A346FK34_9CAUD|nr:hypothetical protein HWB81_gp30 [Bacillus phage Wes44]AXN58339.1 hypothetical protein Wes44_30 [Bacillus phage Wes44]